MKDHPTPARCRDPFSSAYENTFSGLSGAVRRLMCFLTAFALLCCALPAAAEEDPVVVRAGKISYTLSQVQPAFDADLAIAGMMGTVYMTDEEMAAYKDATLQRILGICILRNKLDEAGKGSFTSQEEETLKAEARTRYEELWQQTYRSLSENGTAPEEKDVTLMMNDAGYTVDALYEEMKISEYRSRAVALFCPEITLTEKQVQDYYEEQFLGPDRERYENDIAAYEAEILATGSESFYTPAGYRYLRQILLDYPEEIETDLRRDYRRLEAAMQALSEAVQALAVAAAGAEDWDGIAPARQAYDEILEKANGIRTSYEEKRRALTEPLIAEKVEAIRSQYRSGTDFIALIRKYSSDKSDTNLKTGGYPFHPLSDSWPENFIEAASALEKPGDISEPVYTDLGIHILYYAADMPSGEYKLTEEEQEALRSAALFYYRSMELDMLIGDWLDDYDTELHPELLY